MYTRIVNWAIYTVLIGLIPIALRGLVWVATKSGTVDGLSASDFVAFGLVMHISIINELENADGTPPNWKTVQNGTSIAFISGYGVLFCLSLLTGPTTKLVDISVVTAASMALSAVSLLICYSVYHALDTIDRTLQ